jgi:hypothetical protein
MKQINNIKEGDELWHKWCKSHHNGYGKVVNIQGQLLVASFFDGTTKGGLYFPSDEIWEPYTGQDKLKEMPIGSPNRILQHKDGLVVLCGGIVSNSNGLVVGIDLSNGVSFVTDDLTGWTDITETPHGKTLLNDFVMNIYR